MDNKLDLNTKIFVDSLAGKTPINKLSVQEARDVLNEIQKDKDYNPNVQIKNSTIDNMSITIIRPHCYTGKLPVILYFHGGGWVLGNEMTHHRLICELAMGVNAAVIFFNYTPSPEAKYPDQINNGYKILQYIAANKLEDINIDPTKIIVVGDSVGGNMATVVALMAKNNNGPKILYQVLFYPVTDSEMNTASYAEFANGPWLTKAAMEWFFDNYAPDKASRNQQYISPLQSTIEDLKGLPDTLIINGENDVLRDEGEMYAHKLMNAGVNVTSVRYNGTIHDFVMLKPLKDTPATISAIKLAIATMKDVFKCHSKSSI